VSSTRTALRLSAMTLAAALAAAAGALVATGLGRDSVHQANLRPVDANTHGTGDRGSGPGGTDY
jgi:hypothetical protein